VLSDDKYFHESLQDQVILQVEKLRRVRKIINQVILQIKILNQVA